MTIICAQLTLSSTVHSTDSLLTRRNSRKLAKGSGQPKFLRCPQIRGAFSWWGQVSAGKHWNARTWLEKRIALLGNNPNITADDFATELADEMNYRLRHTHIQPGNGLGLHFTIYDLLDGEWVPDLILITNYSGLEYRGGPAFVAQRQTFHWLSGNSDENYTRHHEHSYRAAVRDHLNTKPIHFSNGQPSIFGQFAPGIGALQNQRHVSDNSFWDPFPLALVEEMTDVHIRRQGRRKSLVGHPCFALHVHPAETTRYEIVQGDHTA